MAATTLGTTPRVLGSYEVLEKIADGGMSSVHKGRHRETGAVVAIKVLSPECAANKVLHERLHQEFRAASLLRHPNVVRALDGGREGDISYLVMEYLPGEDLWQRIEREGPLPEAEAVRIVGCVAGALSAAHARGIIHRDVKPDNILLTVDGEVKLADLGLAKHLAEDVGLTRPGQGLGTPNFIAPEQFAGAKQASVRCDVYSVGATLYMAVTGRVPFEARGVPAVLRKKMNNDLVPPRQFVPGLSERVDAAIRRAVRADPYERYASCREFADALTGRPAARGSATVAEPPPPRPAEERRASTRHACTVAASCDRNSSIHAGQAEEQDRWDATVENLSADGIGLRLSRRFEPGTLLTVSLPASDPRPARTLAMRVTRVRRAARSCWYHGCALARPLSDEELRELL